MFVLDTDVVSNLLKPRPSESLIKRIATVPVDQQATTSITLGEIAYGAVRVGRMELYERAAKLLSGTTILDFDVRAAEEYARTRFSLETQGIRLADPDLRIAAISIANEAVLITGNVRHFSRIQGLSLEDWIRG